jgi:hypothetical protein
VWRPCPRTDRLRWFRLWGRSGRAVPSPKTTSSHQSPSTLASSGTAASRGSGHRRRGRSGRSSRWARGLSVWNSSTVRRSVGDPNFASLAIARRSRARCGVGIEQDDRETRASAVEYGFALRSRPRLHRGALGYELEPRIEDGLARRREPDAFERGGGGNRLDREQGEHTRDAAHRTKDITSGGAIVIVLYVPSQWDTRRAAMDLLR